MLAKSFLFLITLVLWVRVVLPSSLSHTQEPPEDSNKRSAMSLRGGERHAGISLNTFFQYASKKRMSFSTLFILFLSFQVASKPKETQRWSGQELKMERSQNDGGRDRKSSGIFSFHFTFPHQFFSSLSISSGCVNVQNTLLGDLVVGFEGTSTGNKSIIYLPSIPVAFMATPYWAQSSNWSPVLQRRRTSGIIIIKAYGKTWGTSDRLLLIFFQKFSQ